VTDLLLSPAGLGVLGLMIGSFLNVVIFRLPLVLERQWWADTARYQLGDALAWERAFGATAARPPAIAKAAETVEHALSKLSPLSIVRPRSRCPGCGHVLRWHENIPLLGWLRLKGRCAACGAKISARYPIVELVTGLLFAACGAAFGASPATLAWCAAVAMLVAMAFIDLDTQLLPDVLTLPLIGLGVIAAAAGWSGVSLSASAIGAVAGYASLWSISWLYKQLRGVEGMAEGDFKLLAGLGALLGWQALLPTVLLASAVGAVVGIGLILFKGHRKEVPIPFGPYLVGGGLAAMFFGAELASWWNL